MTDLTTPIPYRAEPDWQAVAAIPIVECDEPLHPLSLSRTLRVYPAYARMGVCHAMAECHSRSAVFERLLQVAKSLPAGLHLVVLDAWRPFAVQQYLYDSLYDALKEYYPAADEAHLEHLTRQFVSPPNSSRGNPSPHLTGGAVDVTLCDDDGHWLDMGTAFDEASPRSASAHFEGPDGEAAGQQVRANRRTLYNAMLAQGFSNLPSEWWHYDYGDQLWVWHQGEPQALYGPVQLQTLDSLWRQQLEQQLGLNGR